MNEMDGKTIIVVSSPGGRDTIYVGIGRRVGDMMQINNASMIIHYNEVGVSGLSAQPEHADILRPVTGPNGVVWIPFSSIAAIVLADDALWSSHLGVSRG